MAMNNNASPSQYFRTQLRELVGVESKIRPLGDWLVKNVQNCNELMDTWCEAITNDTHDAQQIFLYLRAINIVLAKRDKTYVAKISNVMEPVLRELVAGGRVVPHTDVYDKIKDLIMAWQNQKLLDTNVAANCLNVIQPEKILHFGGPTSWADEVEMDDPFVTVSPPRNTHLAPAAQQQSVKRSPTAQEKYSITQTKSQQPTIQGVKQTTTTTQQKRSIVVTQVQQQQVKGNEKAQQPVVQQKQVGGKVEYGKVVSPPTTATPVSNTAPSPQAPRAMTLEERVVFLEKVVTDQNLRLEKYHRQNHKTNAFIKELRKEMATLLQRQLIFERGGHPSPTIPETKLLRSIPTSGSSSMSSTPRTPFSHFNTRLNPNAAPFLPDSASASDLISGTDSVSAFSSAEYTDDADYSDEEVATTML